MNKNISGLRFGRLTAVGPSIKKNHDRMWECVCDCGTKKLCRLSALTGGKVKSCGCYRREFKAKWINKSTSSPEYRAWNAMLQRCLNPKCASYKNYGARGISISEEWMNYDVFFSEMGSRPPGMTLERKDNNLGYSKSNCIWADYSSQNKNRRSVVMLEVNGVKKCISDWAKTVGLPRGLIYKRISKGVPVVEALTLESKKNKGKFGVIPIVVG